MLGRTRHRSRYRWESTTTGSGVYPALIAKSHEMDIHIYIYSSHRYSHICICTELHQVCTGHHQINIITITLVCYTFPHVVHRRGINQQIIDSTSVVDLSLSGESQLRALRVEDHVLALQEHIAQDGQSQTAVALDTAKAGGAASRDGSVVDVLARNNGLVVANHDSEVRGVGRARENVATGFLALLSARNLLVVGGDDFVIEEDEGGTGVYTQVSKEVDKLCVR